VGLNPPFNVCSKWGEEITPRQDFSPLKIDFMKPWNASSPIGHMITRIGYLLNLHATMPLL